MSSYLELLESYSDRQWSALDWIAVPPQWYGRPIAIDVDLVLRDPNGHDGEWHAVVTLAHKVVEHEGLGVPLFEGDVERREWEARRLQRRR